jgi:hypothetical protein
MDHLMRERERGVREVMDGGFLCGRTYVAFGVTIVFLQISGD